MIQRKKSATVEESKTLDLQEEWRGNEHCVKLTERGRGFYHFITVQLDSAIWLREKIIEVGG